MAANCPKGAQAPAVAQEDCSWRPAARRAVAALAGRAGLGTSRDRAGHYSDRTGSLEVEVYTSGRTFDYSVLTGTGGWVSLGSVQVERYAGYYAFSQTVEVYAIRVKASNAGLCLDELELYVFPGWSP